MRLNSRILKYSYFLIFPIFLGCTPKAESRQDSSSFKNTQTGSKDMSNPSLTSSLQPLQHWIDLIGSDLEHVSSSMPDASVETDEGRSYEGLKDCLWMHAEGGDKAHYYFQDDALAMVYFNPATKVVTGISPDDFFTSFGEQEAGDVLRSRAGKLANHYVFPEHGLAFSEEDEEVIFIEVFAPCSRASYLKEIYLEPAPFKL